MPIDFAQDACTILYLLNMTVGKAFVYIGMFTYYIYY